MPSTLWSESHDSVLFTVTVINQADKDILIPADEEAAYAIELYFSKNNEFK